LEGILVHLIWLLIYALIIAVVCWIVVRILATFAPPAAAYSWIIWAIGGLLLLILVVRLLGSVIPSPP
jgi:hypothetical protein